MTRIDLRNAPPPSWYREPTDEWLRSLGPGYPQLSWGWIVGSVDPKVDPHIKMYGLVSRGLRDERPAADIFTFKSFHHQGTRYDDAQGTRHEPIAWCLDNVLVL
jgi:hypothetical protein